MQRLYTFANGYVQLQKYLQLSQKGKTIAEYVWIDGSNGLRSKCKVRQKSVVSAPGQRLVRFCARFAAGSNG